MSLPSRLQLGRLVAIGGLCSDINVWSKGASREIYAFLSLYGVLIPKSQHFSLENLLFLFKNRVE